MRICRFLDDCRDAFGVAHDIVEGLGSELGIERYGNDAGAHGAEEDLHEFEAVADRHRQAIRRPQVAVPQQARHVVEAVLQLTIGHLPRRVGREIDDRNPIGMEPRGVVAPVSEIVPARVVRCDRHEWLVGSTGERTGSTEHDLAARRVEDGEEAQPRRQLDLDRASPIPVDRGQAICLGMQDLADRRAGNPPAPNVKDAAISSSRWQRGWLRQRRGLRHRGISQSRRSPSGRVPAHLDRAGYDPARFALGS